MGVCDNGLELSLNYLCISLYFFLIQLLLRLS